MTALTAGVPMLSIPSPMIDNQTNAARLAATGAGRILQPADVTIKSVIREVEGLLGSSACHDSARRTKLAIESLPTQSEVVAALEVVARHQSPLPSPAE
jgi:UDP:flavonoid glycosyltransferase YjiC (YdhE family)